jgi:precorrin-2 dehydrogenase/sirohydrochlorin ferrochelatase
MPRYLPVALNLEGRPVLVVGAGKVGTRRVLELLACGAGVTVISPEASEEVLRLRDEGRVTLHARPYRAGDSEGYFLIEAAASDAAANAAVYAEANARGQLVNVCDDPPHCNYIFASKIERGPLTLSIFTHGAAPAFSRRVRRELEAWLGPEYGALAELLADLRPRVMALPGFEQEDRQRLLERVVYSEALLLFREGKPDEARALAGRILAEEEGRVAFRTDPG